MHILGTLLPENQLARHALTHFFGIGRHIAHRLCARMQIHDRCRIRDLTPYQVTALTAYLSSPSTSPPASNLTLASPDYKPPKFVQPLSPIAAKARPGFSTATTAKSASKDPLLTLKVETDLKREIRENIAHQRSIGSYVGLRHAMNLPVRGQNTQTNARTAKRLNRIERHL